MLTATTGKEDESPKRSKTREGKDDGGIVECRRLVGQAEIKAAALKPDAEILTSRLSSSLKRDEIPTIHYATPLVDQSAAHYSPTFAS